MKRFAFVFITLLAALILTGCPGVVAEPEPDPVPDPVTYSLRDTGPAGGLIFYIDEADAFSWDYLEAAPADQSSAQAWIEGGSTQTTENGNTSTGIGTGSANTDAIIAQTDHTVSAAQICRDYDGGGMTDWFLPSKDELNLMYTNLRQQSVGDFTGDFYWSSSEFNDTSARRQYFFDGNQNFTSKFGVFLVRAARAF
ncbi:MAG: DUF1566 domain-containing protein [Spirochaetales bacterium]|nr:DUF1566 domain-containing protein [Spirochaetales bacterium]